LIKQIIEQFHVGRRIKQIELGAKGSYIILTDNNWYNQLSIPRAVGEKLYQLYLSKQEIKSVTLGKNNKWVIVGGGNTFT
tara:strand:- start:9773 stop:10012 length:240 start_codon:yes stop_codon:yes gene_type:complete